MEIILTKYTFVTWNSDHSTSSTFILYKMFYIKKNTNKIENI